MTTVRTHRAGTRASLRRAPVAALEKLHLLRLPTPWDVGEVQVYVVEDDALTLIDAGVESPESWAALEAGLDELGRSVDEIERVIVTHHHADHMGQIQALRDAGIAVEVWAHEDEAPDIELYSPERHARVEETGRLFREFGVPEEVVAAQGEAVRGDLLEAPRLCRATQVDHLLRDGERIAFKDFELEVLHAPGHTPGHILLREAGAGALITGDHLMGAAVPSTDNYYLCGDLPDPSDPLRREPRFKGLPLYLESLRRLRREGVATILPSHGGVVRQPRRAIEDAALFYEVRVQRIERGLRKLAMMGQEVTGWEIWKALFPNDDPVREMRTRMLMVIGALDALEERGACIASRRADGVLEHHHV